MPKLPIPFGSGWLSDRVRARVMSDARISGPAWVVAVVLAEHVRAQGRLYRCDLKQSTIAHWGRVSERTVQRGVDQLVRLGVVEVQRGRYGAAYAFQLAWYSRWQPVGETRQSGGSGAGQMRQSGGSRGDRLAGYLSRSNEPESRRSEVSGVERRRLREASRISQPCCGCGEVMTAHGRRCAACREEVDA